MFSISSVPPKQSVSDTITILSGRLGSATLLEDRRAAILGLRSFAKDFPASVASGALRSLISSLAKDGEDVDTVKVILETLLMLFSPNEGSPEASDEVVLWLADEFTQHQENITLLLDLLIPNEFYPRLYSLKLLAAILAARTERTEECILTAPLGLSRLVAVLVDSRDAVRNEATGLLTHLTSSSVEIQKLVAFENAFELTFGIIEADGSLSEGGGTVEDCLILLANLLRRNSWNQSLFRESGHISRLTQLLSSYLDLYQMQSNMADWAQAQRNRNIYAFLAVIRLFLAPGSVGVAQNQNVFWQQGLVSKVLQLAFSYSLEIQIRAEALITCGDMIRDVPILQESFAQLRVTPSPEYKKLSLDKVDGQTNIYVIDGLLDLTLNFQDQVTFDLRFAACECLKSYLLNHSEVRMHFLRRAINGYQTGSNESANVLTVLLEPFGDTTNADPYRSWFAAVVVFHLLWDNPTAKGMALAVTEGDLSEGEEVVTSIQTITAHLITGIQRRGNPRILVGYLMVLLCWLFEDLDAVNDFLMEGSNVQSLVQAILQPYPSGELVQGLCAMLLGFVYEFSTKNSPISRSSLHSILSSRLDREIYLDRLHKLRIHPFMRDFEVMPQRHDSIQGGLPNVFFDNMFVNLFKDNYSRMIRAIDGDPGVEVSIITNGVQRGISRELVDSLRTQIEEKSQALEDVKASAATLEKSLHHCRSEQERLVLEMKTELLEAKSASKTMDETYGAQLRKLERQQSMMQSEHQNKLIETQKAYQAELENMKRKIEVESTNHKITTRQLDAELAKVNDARVQELEALRKEHAIVIKDRISQMQQLQDKNDLLQAQLDESHLEGGKVNSRLIEVETRVISLKTSREATQSELDDLLIVFGDLEGKLEKYKMRLRELGEIVSDGEDEDSFLQ